MVRIAAPGQQVLCGLQSQLDAFSFQSVEVFEKRIQRDVSCLNESPVGEEGGILSTKGELISLNCRSMFLSLLQS